MLAAVSEQRRQINHFRQRVGAVLASITEAYQRIEFELSLREPTAEQTQVNGRLVSAIKNLEIKIQTLNSRLVSDEVVDVSDIQREFVTFQLGFENCQKKLNDVEHEKGNPFSGIHLELRDKYVRILETLRNQLDLVRNPYQHEPDEIDENGLLAFLQQSCVEKHKSLQTEVDQAFDWIKLHYSQQAEDPLDFGSARKQKSVFLSYAWASWQHPFELKVVHPFLERLAEHLSQAGIKVYLDIKDSRFGFSGYAHMDRVQTADNVVVVATESFKDKHHAPGHKMVKTELNGIREKKSRTQDPHAVMFLVLTGSMMTAIPEEFRGYSIIEAFASDLQRDGIEVHYLSALFNIIGYVYNKGGLANPLYLQDTALRRRMEQRVCEIYPSEGIAALREEFLCPERKGGAIAAGLVNQGVFRQAAASQGAAGPPAKLVTAEQQPQLFS